MATPFSQLVGIQALLNVVQGERYVTIPDENLMYLAGRYGNPPGELDQDVLDRAVRRPSAGARCSATADAAAAVARGDPPPTTASTSPTRSCCCATSSPARTSTRCTPRGSPIEPVYPLGGPHGLGWLSDVMDSTSARSLTASRGGVCISLRR